MATLKLKDGLVQNSNTFSGDFTVDTNDRSMAVGPIEISGTAIVNGSFTVMSEVNITGTVNIGSNGTFDVR